MNARKILSLFLSNRGSINHQWFWGGFIGLALFVTAYNALLRFFGPESMTTFWIIVLGLPVMFYMIICVYCKRLVDMGRTRWVFTGAIVLQILVIIGLMLAFGGAEYFSEFAQYDRKEDIDPVRQKEIIDAYQARQAANMHIIKPAMLIVPVLLTMWLAVAKSSNNAN